MKITTTTLKAVQIILFSLNIPLLMLNVGCKDNPGTLEYDVLFVNLPNQTNIVAENPFELPIHATVRSKVDSSPAKDVRVEFFVTSGPASFPAPVTLSNDEGLASTFLRVVPTSGGNNFQIAALVSGGQTHSELTVNGVAPPASIKIIGVPERLYSIRSDDDVGKDVIVEFDVISFDSNNDTVAIQLPLVKRLTRLYDGLFGHILDNKFYSDGRFGSERLVVITDLPGLQVQLSDTSEINILPLQPVSVQIVRNLTVLPDSIASLYMALRLNDYEGKVPAGLIFEFSADWGMFDQETDTTDSSGAASLRWTNDGDRGNVNINVKLRDSNFEGSWTFCVVFEIPHTGLLTLMTDRDTIVVSAGRDVAHLSIRLRNGDGDGVPGKTITFSSTYGSYIEPVVTDIRGIARTIFRDVGLPTTDREGNLIPAMIYARSSEPNLIDSVEVTIRPQNPVGEIFISCDKLEMVACSRDSANVRSIVLLDNGKPAPAGMLVQFEVLGANGMFIPSAVPLKNNGIADTKYIAGNFVGKTRIRASVMTRDSIIYSNLVDITLVPSEPRYLRVNTNPGKISVGDTSAVALITAWITDTSGNPSGQGLHVTFTTTLGEITPSAIADETCRAFATLKAGVRSGVAEISGSTTLPGGESIMGRCTAEIQGDIPDSIRVTADPSVVGFGGSSLIYATVIDKYGNVPKWPVMVFFELPDHPDQPGGCTFQGRTIDSARTTNGIAIATLNAGREEGSVFLSIYTFSDPYSACSGDDGLLRTDTVRVEGHFAEICK